MFDETCNMKREKGKHLIVGTLGNNNGRCMYSRVAAINVHGGITRFTNTQHPNLTGSVKGFPILRSVETGNSCRDCQTKSRGNARASLIYILYRTEAGAGTLVGAHRLYTISQLPVKNFSLSKILLTARIWTKKLTAGKCDHADL